MLFYAYNQSIYFLPDCLARDGEIPVVAILISSTLKLGAQSSHNKHVSKVTFCVHARKTFSLISKRSKEKTSNNNNNNNKKKKDAFL